MNWSKINIKDLEKVFDEVFNAEMFYGFHAVEYDEAFKKSSYFGTTWKKEMENEDVYYNFVTDFLENEGLTPNYFKEN